MNFPDTNWTALAKATLNGSEEEKQAMNELCQRYWKPVALTIKSKGVVAERVDDLTQDFFLQLMEKRFFKKADAAKGKFRTFILGSLKYFLADDAKKNSRQKKGGHLERAPLVEDNIIIEQEDDAYFDRAWAEMVFERVYSKIEQSVIEVRGPQAWSELKKFLPGSPEKITYIELGDALGLSEGGSKAEVSRMRSRFREALRAEVGMTVDAPHEIDQELNHLRSALEQTSL